MERFVEKFEEYLWDDCGGLWFFVGFFCGFWGCGYLGFFGRFLWADVRLLWFFMCVFSVVCYKSFFEDMVCFAVICVGIMCVENVGEYVW